MSAITPMLESIAFRNFKVLQSTSLQLEPLTLIVGPNGSGKSTVFEALRLVASGKSPEYKRLTSVDPADPTVGEPQDVSLAFRWRTSDGPIDATWRVKPGVMFGQPLAVNFLPSQSGGVAPNVVTTQALKSLRGFQTYTFSPQVINQPTSLRPDTKLDAHGEGLAVVLDLLRDSDPERFEEFNADFGRWFPEYDRVLFTTPQEGFRSFAVRTRYGKHRISAAELSHGTLVALAILALAYVPDAPLLIGLEEPEMRIHPRLLREVYAAIRRLCYPAEYGDSRVPRQVIMTTHSPYLLDLFRDEPASVVIAQRAANSATFERLSDRADFEEVTRDIHLGDAWYSGVLGGVPTTA